MKSYERVVAEFRSRVWAVRPETLNSMLELVARWAAGEKFSPDEVEDRIRESNARNGMNRGGDGIYRETVLMSSGSQRGGSPRAGGSGVVALIPVIGVISNRATMLESISSGGGCSVQKVTSQFRQAMASPRVKTIVLDVDSPGGSVDGVFELAQEIYEARGRKKVIAVANTLAASAAYAIAAAASELVVAPSGQVGSIGVYTSHEDHSKALERAGVKVTLISAGKYKTEGTPIEPLSDAGRAEIQEKVDFFYQMFIRAVAVSRNDTQANVRAGYGQARCEIGTVAVRANLADRVGTLDDVLARLGVARPGMASSGGARMDPPDEDYAMALRRRKLELDLMGMESVTRRDAPTTVEGMEQDLARRRLARRSGNPGAERGAGGAAPDESVAAAHRRLQIELDLMRM